MNKEQLEVLLTQFLEASKQNGNSDTYIKSQGSHIKAFIKFIVKG